MLYCPDGCAYECQHSVARSPVPGRSHVGGIKVRVWRIVLFVLHPVMWSLGAFDAYLWRTLALARKTGRWVECCRRRTGDPGPEGREVHLLGVAAIISGLVNPEPECCGQIRLYQSLRPYSPDRPQRPQLTNATTRRATISTKESSSARTASRAGSHGDAHQAGRSAGMLKSTLE